MDANVRWRMRVTGDENRWTATGPWDEEEILLQVGHKHNMEQAFLSIDDAKLFRRYLTKAIRQQEARLYGEDQ